METNRRKFIRTGLILFAAGLAISVYQGIRRGDLNRLPVFFSDMAFTECILFFFVGAVQLLGNMNAFTSTSFSFKFVHRLFRNEKQEKTDKVKDEFLSYRDTRKKHPMAAAYLLTAAGFLVLSLLFIPFT